MLSLSRCAINVVKAREFVYTLAANSAQPDLHALATAAGWNQSNPLIVNITAGLINSLRLDGAKTFPKGLRINISAATTIAGVINGGTAIYSRVPVTIDNLGRIAGGGGGGGYGQDVWCSYGSSTMWGMGGSGGNGAGFANVSSLQLFSESVGQAGSYSEYSGAVLGGQSNPWAQGGSGGQGGGLGIAGGWGGSGAIGGSYYQSGRSDIGLGGQPGFYVDGNSFVTWVNTGQCLGRVI